MYCLFIIVHVLLMFFMKGVQSCSLGEEECLSSSLSSRTICCEKENCLTINQLEPEYKVCYRSCDTFEKDVESEVPVVNEVESGDCDGVDESTMPDGTTIMISKQKCGGECPYCPICTPANKYCQITETTTKLDYVLSEYNYCVKMKTKKTPSWVYVIIIVVSVLVCCCLYLVCLLILTFFFGLFIPSFVYSKFQERSWKRKGKEEEISMDYGNNESQNIDGLEDDDKTTTNTPNDGISNQSIKEEEEEEEEKEKEKGTKRRLLTHEDDVENDDVNERDFRSVEYTNLLSGTN